MITQFSLNLPTSVCVSLSISLTLSPPLCLGLSIHLSLALYLCVCVPQLLSVARGVLGRRGLSLLLRPFVYAQFVAGETEGEISRSMTKMADLGLRPMLAVPLEEDLGESTG